MKCADVDILLQLAADDEITDEERVQIEEHLSSCLFCRRKEAWLDELAQHLSVPQRLSVSERCDVADAVVAAMTPPRWETVRRDTDMVVSKKKQKKQGRRKGVVARLFAMIWTRKRRKETPVKKPKRDPHWIETAAGAILPAPTSLEGFRQAKSGVTRVLSGPVQAIRWVSGVAQRGKGR